MVNKWSLGRLRTRQRDQIKQDIWNKEESVDPDVRRVLWEISKEQFSYKMKQYNANVNEWW